jgi:hypothetical protein
MNHDKPAAKPDMEQFANDVEPAPDQYQWESTKSLGIA